MNAHQEVMDCREKTEAGIETGQEPTEAESKTGLEGVKAMDLEVNPEETEAVLEQKEIPNKEGILETIGAPEDRSWDKRPAVEY